MTDPAMSAAFAVPSNRPPSIRTLLSYRVHTVANLLSRGAALRYRREFDVSLWEWRTIGLLGEGAPWSLQALARAAGLDKGQLSRVVAGLVERGLVARAVDAADARGVRLTLTREGRRVGAGLLRAAGERNDVLTTALTTRERAQLEAILAKLGDAARTLIERERAGEVLA